MAVPMLVAAEATYELRRHCEKRKLELDEARRPWLEHCRSVATELFPHKLPYIEDPGSTAAKGQERNQHITDAVGHLALTTVAAGIHQGMMPSSSPWFGLRIRGLTTPEWPVAGFLEQSVHALREMHNQSNANHVLPESQQEWAGFGTAAALVIEDDEDDFRLDGMSVGEYWIADDARGRVDTLYREISMTIGQLIEMFGEENLSPSAESEARQHRWDTRVTVVHAIEPDRDGLNPMRSPDMPWRSVYYEESGNAATGVLGVRGFRRFPAIVWRYSRIPGSAYGYGRGQDALPHLVRLRRMIVRYSQAVANKADPAVQIPVGLMAHEVRMLPGQATRLKGSNDKIQNARQVTLELAELAEEMERTRQDIRDVLGATLVASLRRIQRQMTAREADLRTSQDLTEWLPSLYRQQDEMQSPYIELLWDIAAQRGRLPEIPEELEDETIDIEFTSPLARKQDEAEVDSIVETLAISNEIAKAVPETLDNFDFDVAARRISAIKGVPADMVVAQDDMDQLRAARARQQQAEAQAAAAQQGAELARTAAEAERVA